MQTERNLEVWKIVVNFLVFKKIKRHLHDVYIFGGYDGFFYQNVSPYRMAEIIIDNMDDFIEGCGDSGEIFSF